MLQAVYFVQDYKLTLRIYVIMYNLWKQNNTNDRHWWWHHYRTGVSLHWRWRHYCVRGSRYSDKRVWYLWRTKSTMFSFRYSNHAPPTVITPDTNFTDNGAQKISQNLHLKNLWQEYGSSSVPPFQKHLLIVMLDLSLGVSGPAVEAGRSVFSSGRVH